MAAARQGHVRTEPGRPLPLPLPATRRVPQRRRKPCGEETTSPSMHRSGGTARPPDTAGAHWGLSNQCNQSGGGGGARGWVGVVVSRLPAAILMRCESGA